MVNLVSEAAWNDAFAGKFHSIYFDPKYLNLVSRSFGYKLTYYIASKGGKLLFATALFSKNKRIIAPYSYTYNSIFFCAELSDIKYLEIMESLLQTLKANYSKISLRLPPEISDLRPFIWEGFSITNRYTYYRNPSDTLSAKMLKKVNQRSKNLRIEVENANDRDITLNLQEAAKYGLPTKLVANYRFLFAELSIRGYLKAFQIYDRDCLVASQLAIIDQENALLSTISISVLTNTYVVPFLNNEIFKWCKNNHINLIDMVGANEKGIANFKYSFNATLTTYHLVDYSKRVVFLRSFILKTKLFAKKILIK